ncbi:MAG: cytochrome c [Halopseudomonas sp.]|uniref:c-type cytochrome n=1 Tax=Halopseudomonas sp. TaxID=2901191 RepID=UPI0030038543
MKAIRWLLPVGCLLLLACNQDMDDQPRYEAYEEAPNWPNLQSARLPVTGTVARGAPLLVSQGHTAQTLPMPLTLTLPLLQRGRQQYQVFCAPCHGDTGAGDGSVVQHGFPAPPSYHSDRLRQAALGHIYSVITDGYGIMYSYAARVAPDDRWAIAAYVRALQLSQHAGVADLTPQQRAALDTLMPAVEQEATQ